LTIAIVLLHVGVSVAVSQWTRVAGIPATNVSSLAVKNGLFLAGTDSTVYVSTNCGADWRRGATLPGPLYWVDAVTSFEGKIFAGTGGSGVFVSADNGAHWTALNQGLAGLGSLQISGFAEWRGKLYVATGGAGVFVLQQNVWVPFGDLVNEVAGTVTYLGVIGDSLVAGAGGNGYLWFATPTGSGWSGVQVGMPGSVAFSIYAVERRNGSWITGSSYGAHVSSDNAATWVPSTNRLPNYLPILFVPFGSDLYSFALFNSTRIHKSTNGHDWVPVDTVRFVFAAVKLGNLIYTGCEDGLWYREFPLSDVEDPSILPTVATLSQNFPNPFNPSTTIRFSIPSGGQVILSVYDMLGREVARIVDGRMERGEHSFQFDGSNLASGVYFTRVQFEASVVIVRMMLVR
jgi:hypothetical protein